MSRQQQRDTETEQHAGPTDDTTSSAPGVSAITAPVPVVGIGASAGGLDACLKLLKALPADTGLAYVFVLHLDPERPSLFADLLSEATEMPVVEVQEPTAVAANHCYSIPPTHSLRIKDGVLQLFERVTQQGRHLPVDRLFQSLAAELGDKAIGVILSGAASDGTLGMRAIKAAGGITFAQDQASAEHFGMPGSAIAAGCVDQVLSVTEIARQLARIGQYQCLRSRSKTTPLAGASEETLAKIFKLLTIHTGNDFSQYKRSTILRRIRRRMAMQKLERVDAYARLLEAEPNEIDSLFDDLLITVTSFFREPDSFEALRLEVLPQLFEHREPSRPLRVWIPGCATGEEVYSLAITLLEYMGDSKEEVPIQIFATDIHAKSIEHARAGVYMEAAVATVPTELLRRYFSQCADGWRITKRIRDLCVFSVQNLIRDPPFSRLDLISCRNLLIYLEPALQQRALQTFSYALQPNGFLMLGSSESIGAHAELFLLVDKSVKIYRNKGNPKQRIRSFSPHPFEPTVRAGQARTPDASGDDLAAAVRSRMLQEYAPPGVVVDKDMQVQHFYGDTGPFLNPTPGAASLHLLKLARPELTLDLRAAAHAALLHGGPVREPRVSYHRDGAEAQVDIHVLPLTELSQDNPLLLVLFDESTAEPQSAPAETPAGADSRSAALIAELSHDLAATRASMQSILQEQDGTNEALQSANEELQSANEELETAKEELESTNEELSTVNDELESRNLDLGAANSDLINLLASVNLPIVMLDRRLNIRSFSPQAKKLLNLIDADIGRPIGNIRGNIESVDFAASALGVVEKATAEVLELQDRNGRWYELRMRPYQSIDRRIDGVVMAFIDIDSRKAAAQLRQRLEREQRLAAIVRDSRDAITLQGFDGSILAWNAAAERIFGYPESQALGMNITTLMPPEAVADYRSMLLQLRNGSTIEPAQIERIAATGQRLHLWLTATALASDKGEPYAVSTTERLLDSPAP